MSPGDNAKKFTLKSVKPDEQQFGLVWYCRKKNTILFQGDATNIGSAKSKLVSIANKQLNENIAWFAECEPSSDDLGLPARDPESISTSFVGGKSQTEN